MKDLNKAINKIQSMMNPNMSDIKFEVTRKNTLRKVTYKNRTYEVFDNYANKGIMCIFTYNNTYYMADFCYIDLYDAYEVAIFYSDEVGNMLNDKSLFIQQFEEKDFNDNTLVKCIDEFLRLITIV